MIQGTDFNMEGMGQQSFNPFDALEDFGQRLENNPERVSDAEILSKFDDNQLDYINNLQENPSWSDMNAGERIEYVKDAVEKFCHNTDIGRYWTNHWKPIVHCLINNMPKI